ncbi:MAG TPA: hypothetical protein VET89_10150 [Stellaceae bacterium]|jgi:hypothetical protein|nr:hypothetical protein [Stellaceae bacterium]
MPADESKRGFPAVAQIGLAALGAALAFRALALPIAVGCLAALTGAALCRDSEARAERAPQPAPKRRARRRDNGVTEASQDSFPASDPPSWTPVTGPGTHH